MRYTAFISYNSKDDKWAKWLQRKLESYNIPVKLGQDQDDEPVKKLRVFRYRADLNTVSLREGLAQELDEARWLIVVCSPNSAKSEWVGMEIQHFIDTGRRDKILPFIVSGTSYADDENECLNPVLKNAFPNGDVLGVNINDYGDDPYIYRKRKALVRTVSILIEVPNAYHDLWNRYRMRFWEGVALKALGGMAIVGLILYALNYYAPFDAKVQLREQTIKNESLPKPDSLLLMLKLQNEEKVMVLHSIDSIAVYKNLPGNYAGKEAHLSFKAHGYETIDTVVLLLRNEEMVLDIRRDDTFGLLAGTVTDEMGQPLEGATVVAEGQAGTSDEKGRFEIRIPLPLQRPLPHVSISKQGYQTEVFSEQPIGRNWQVMLLK